MMTTILIRTMMKLVAGQTLLLFMLRPSEVLLRKRVFICIAYLLCFFSPQITIFFEIIVYLETSSTCNHHLRENGRFQVTNQ
jgi:hypothetical protein